MNRQYCLFLVNKIKAGPIVFIKESNPKNKKLQGKEAWVHRSGGNMLLFYSPN